VIDEELGKHNKKVGHAHIFEATTHCASSALAAVRSLTAAMWTVWQTPSTYGCHLVTVSDWSSSVA